MIYEDFAPFLFAQEMEFTYFQHVVMTTYFNYALMKYFLFFALICLFITVHSQSNRVSEKIIKDFAVSFYYKHHFEKVDAVRSVAYLAGNRLGYKVSDVFVAVEQLETNSPFREELFKTLFEHYRDQELLILNLISLGMTAYDAKALAYYIVTRYGGISTNTGRSDLNQDVEKIYDSVDVEPEYEGGLGMMRRVLNRSFYYPDSALKHKIEGRVRLQFVVERDGRMTDLHVVQGGELGYGLPEEAVRLVNELANWRAAKIGGLKVRYRKSVSVHFTIAEGINVAFEKSRQRQPNSQAHELVTPKKARVILGSINDLELRNDSLFQGAKIFCDEEGLWKFKVTINKSSFLIQTFPAGSTMNKKEEMVAEVNGSIKDGRIFIETGDAVDDSIYFYKDGSLYERYNSGDYVMRKACN